MTSVEFESLLEVIVQLQYNVIGKITIITRESVLRKCFYRNYNRMIQDPTDCTDSWNLLIKTSLCICLALRGGVTLSFLSVCPIIKITVFSAGVSVQTQSIHLQH